MRYLMILALVLDCAAGVSQSTDKVLEKKVSQILNGFHGQVGVHILHIPSGRTVSINADTIFPTASMVKIPILIAITDKLKKGELTYHQELIYRDSLLYAGSDILGSFKDSEKVELSKVMMLMLTESDNTASLWLQSLAGTGTRINHILDSLGLVNTRVNSRTPGREANRNLYGWGQTTPREMARLMEMLYKGEIFDKSSSGRMIRLLGRNAWDEEAISQIPSEVFVASKNGAVDASRSETLLVMAPHGPYIFSIITKNQSDTRWDSDNEGWVLARKLSRQLWTYFEPKSTWVPPVGVDGK